MQSHLGLLWDTRWDQFINAWSLMHLDSFLDCGGMLWVVRVNTFVWLDLFKGLDQKVVSCIACKYSQYSHVFFTRGRPPSIGNKRYAQQQFALDWDLCPGAVW